MKTLLLLALTSTAFAADWGAVRQIRADRKIEIVTRNGREAHGYFVSADEDALTFRETPGTRSLARSEIRRVRVFDPRRRIFKGLIWMGVGAAAGAGAGVAACPYCSNEGHTSPYIGTGAAVGAGIGALGFLCSPYRTVYKSK